jgi:steroid 5-alpha reductase family enzyme
MLVYLLSALGVSVLINGLLFVVAFRYKTDRLTDISYALSFIALALYALYTGSLTPARFVLYAMIFMWAARLGGFLLFRIWRTGVDHRFDGIRESFWKFSKFWLAQAVSVWVILLSSLLAFAAPNLMFTWLSVLGAAVWGLGWLIETVADAQKYRFTTNPANKDKWIATGIWKYSRHPNYFGEMLVWIGLYIMVLPVLSGWSVVVALASPLFIVCLLLFVSGIPPLEKSADARWGNNPDYQAYKKRTSVLVLLPPK